MGIFRKVLTRRHLLLTLSGIGSTALLVGLVAKRDVILPAGNDPAAIDPTAIVPPATPTLAPTVTPTAAATPTVEATATPKVVALDIACAGDELAFSPSDLAAPANSQIQLTFHNVSSYFDHNWVLVDGDEAVVEAVLADAAAAGEENEFLPKDLSHVIAHTQVVSSGVAETITFAAPAPGEYPFFCAFPGHALAGMRGTLTITA